MLLNPEAAATLTAARAAEQSHHDALIDAVAQAMTETLTVPDPEIFTSIGVFLETSIELEEIVIATYLAATKQFASQGEAELAQFAFRIGAIEAEHRVGLHFFAIAGGELTGVPNEVAFEKALFSTVAEAAAALEDLGFIGGDGAEITVPGPGDIDAINMTEREQGGEAVECALSDTPVAGEGTPVASEVTPISAEDAFPEPGA